MQNTWTVNVTKAVFIRYVSLAANFHPIRKRTQRRLLTGRIHFTERKSFRDVDRMFRRVSSTRIRWEI